MSVSGRVGERDLPNGSPESPYEAARLRRLQSRGRPSQNSTNDETSVNSLGKIEAETEERSIDVEETKEPEESDGLHGLSFDPPVEAQNSPSSADDFKEAEPTVEWKPSKDSRS